MLAIVLALAASAPIPKPKAAIFNPTGSWECRWGAPLSIMRFEKDGTYLHQAAGYSYSGTWRRVGNVVHVEEAQSGYQRIMKWSFTAKRSGGKWECLTSGDWSGMRFTLEDPK